MFINTTDRVQWGAFIIYIIFSAAVGDVVRTVKLLHSTHIVYLHALHRLRTTDLTIGKYSMK